MTRAHDARQDAINELAAANYERLRAQLQAGNAQLASAIGEAISHLMTDDICNEQMFYAVMPNGSTSPRYKKLVEKALQDRAEVEAIREIEQSEADPDNCRPQTRAMARRLDEVGSRF